MITTTISNGKWFRGTESLIEGLSTDGFPVSHKPGTALALTNGAMLYFMDTCELYKYDLQNAQWIQVFDTTTPTTAKITLNIASGGFGMAYQIPNVPLNAPYQIDIDAYWTIGNQEYVMTSDIGTFDKYILNIPNVTGDMTINVDAEEVEFKDYTEFRNIAYIDTGYQLSSANNNNTIIELDVAFTGSDALFGYNKSNANQVLMGSFNGKAAFRWGVTTITYGENLVVGRYYKMRINTITKEFSVNDTTISAVFGNIVTSNPITLGVFFGSTNPSFPDSGAIDVRSLRINVDGEDVVNIKSANTDGMFDIVSKKYLTNSNTRGTIESRNFIDDYELINGIDNQGIGAFNTGVTPSNDYIVKCSVTPRNLSGKSIFGCQSTDSIYASLIYNGSGFYLGTGGVFSKPITLGIKNNIVWEINPDYTFTVNVNGEIGTRNWNAPVSLSSIPYGIGVFSNYANTGHVQIMNGIIHQFSLEMRDKQETFEFLAVKRKADGVVGFYCPQQNIFYTHSSFIEYSPFTGYDVLVNGITNNGSGYIYTPFSPLLADITKYRIEADRTYLRVGTIDFEGCSGDVPAGRLYYGIGVGSYLNTNTDSSYSSTGLALPLNQKVTVSLDLSTKYAYLDGVQSSRELTIPTTQSQNLSILGRTENSTTVSSINNTVAHETRIYKNNVLIHEFVPVKRKSDGKLGVYDTINSVFIAGSGTLEEVV